MILSRAGLGNITTSNDSREVPTVLMDYSPDLILLDLHMPHLDGFALLEIINRHAAGQFLPVLVLTADTTRDAVHRALRLGAHDFLTKPFDVEEVTIRVRNLLRTRIAYLELRRHNSRLQDHLESLDLVSTATQDSWDVRRARVEGVLAAGGPRMVFQSVVDLRTERIVGYEALARFDNEPVRGPDQWFIEADAVGLGVALEVQAVRAALTHLPLLTTDEFLAINVSPATALADLHTQLGAHTPWDRVVLELTEHVLIEDYSSIQHALQSLRAAGARLSVDDTGAGFASLRHILNLVPDYVKLDISLCRGVDHDPARRALASALVTFTQDTNAIIIAEGIETPEERATLLNLGVHHGQGYLLGRPGPLPQLR
jgi:EAL domain-containing protein (putative c-di-GMP-specific phosphodiesterase class I)